MRSPRFWNKQDGLLVAALRPLGKIYGDIARGRIQAQPSYISKLPVICVGNVTMGGSGKTPVVQAIVKLLQDAGKNPAVLMRGYGGKIKQTLSVDAVTHTAALVGDEALLHAQHGAVVVSADRVKGAQAIEKDKWHTHIVMDDGLQNPGLKKSLSFLVVDGSNPFGNGEIFPAGPLREYIDDAVRRVDAMIVVGSKNDAVITRFGFLFPIFQAHLVPINGAEFSGISVMAFAGIGNPKKFFNSLADTGAHIVDRHVYPDHYRYSDHDIKHLKDKAAHANVPLVTTRKDWVRLSPSQREDIRVLDVVLHWEDEAAFKTFLHTKGSL